MSWTLYGDALSGKGGRRMSKLRKITTANCVGYSTSAGGFNFEVDNGKLRAEVWVFTDYGDICEESFEIDPADLARFLKENFPEVMK
jgi:hypothetical protein